MKKKTKVSWLACGAAVRSHGVTVSDEEDGHVLVAVNSDTFEYVPTFYRMVIYCRVEQLTREP